MNALVSVSSLVRKLRQADCQVFDCRFNLMDPEAGRNAYVQAHIPGAYYADLNQNLSAPHIPGETGRHPLPDKQDWIEQVQQWGITPDVSVVAYDDAGGVFAARLWWLLRWIGHEKVSVLDGGWQAWLASTDAQTSSAEPDCVPSDYNYAALASLTREIDVDAIDATQQELADARELPRYLGEQEPIDPVAGHIPGAVCMPMSANLDDNGRFKKAEALQAKFSALMNDRDVVCYCGSGVTATHNILAMKLAGFDEPILYAGSWSEWITDPSRPVATGVE